MPAWSILPCNPVTANDLRRVTLDRVVDVASPGDRTLRMPALPLSIDQSRPRDLALPELGEHTAEILATLAA